MSLLIRDVTMETNETRNLRVSFQPENALFYKRERKLADFLKMFYEDILSP